MTHAVGLVNAAGSTTEDSITAWATLGAVIVALGFGIWGIVARWLDGQNNQAKRVAFWGEMERNPADVQQFAPVLYIHNGSDHPIYAVLHPCLYFDDSPEVPPANSVPVPPEEGGPGVEYPHYASFGTIAAGTTYRYSTDPESTNRTPKPLRIAFTDIRGVRWRLWMDGTLKRVHTPLRPGDPVPKMVDDPLPFPGESAGYAHLSGFKRGRPPGSLPL